MTLSPSRTYRLLDGAGGSTLVVCVHGLTGDSRQFCYLAPLLASAEGVAAVACVDLPGHGASSCADPWRDDVGDAAVESIAAVVADAATRSRAADLVVVGFSMGTLHATRYADAAGDFEKALAVGAHGAYARQAERHVAQQVRGNAGYVDRVGAEIRHLLSGERGDATFLQDALASVIRRPGRPKLLLVYGADDTVVGGGIVSHDEDALRAAAAVVVLDGAGHKPIMTHPQGVLEALRAHVL
ncbi:hypothetical protein SO694_00016360 [Aureococcus anophagefferens]|uniref:AB hydrolase-1 domain-containing protein n=1 Tax=Aureococcus anophagefferens TaxID=44056 RepID=A0ABR1G2M3_AURAN